MDKKLSMKSIGVLFALSVLLFACSVAPGDRSYGIKQPAVGRGVVSNQETLNNGLGQTWIFGDTTYVYCTLDKALQDKVKHIMLEEDATMIYTYRDWIETDIEYASTDPTSGARISTMCGQGVSGSRGSKLLSVEKVGEPMATPTSIGGE